MSEKSAVILNSLEIDARHRGYDLKSIRVEGHAIFGQNHGGEDVSSVPMVCNDRLRSEIRAEALNRGLDIR